MAILCRDIGLLLLQAPHTGSTSLGTLLRTELGGAMMVEERVRDARGRIVLRQKHQTLAQLMEAGLVTPEQRANLLVVVGIRNPYDLVLTEYARNREAGSISAPQRLLRRLPGASPDFSPRDFERFVQRRYEPGREDWAGHAEEILSRSTFLTRLLILDDRFYYPLRKLVLAVRSLRALMLPQPTLPQFLRKHSMHGTQ